MRRGALLSLLMCAGLLLGIGSGSVGGGSIGARLVSIAESLGVLEVDPYASPTLIFDYKPFSAPHTLPTCTSGNNCAMQCTAYATGNLWRCVTGAGGLFTVTQGTAVPVTNPWGGTSAWIKSGADSPIISSANLGALATLFSSPHTVVVTGYSGATNLVFPFRLTTGSADVYMRQEGGAKCYWVNTGATPNNVDVKAEAVGTSTEHGWSILTCRKSGSGGASQYTSRINGLSTTTAWGYDPDNMTGGTFYFGSYNGASYSMVGQLESFTVYTDAKSDDEIADIEAAYMGTMPTTSVTGDPLYIVRGSGSNAAAWILDTEGYYLPAAAGFMRTSTAGLYLEENNNEVAGGALWANDNRAAATWTAVGTPTTTSNNVNGPWFRWLNTADADTVSDDDAAAFEGYTAVNSAGNAADRYTASCFVKAGTSTKARIAVTTDATGSTSCDKTLSGGSYANSFERISCTADITGSPTYVRGQILVGNATSDTGTIVVAQCQMDRDGWASSPRVQGWLGTNVSLDIARTSSAETDAWTQTSGSMQIIYTPDFSTTDLYNADDTYEFDLYNDAQNDHRMLLWKYQNDQYAVASRGSGGATTTTDTYATSSPTVTAGHTYAFRFKWSTPSSGKNNHYIYFDECSDVSTCYATTLIGSDTTGTKVAATLGDWGKWDLHCRYSNTLCMEGRIVRASVWNQ